MICPLLLRLLCFWVLQSIYCPNHQSVCSPEPSPAVADFNSVSGINKYMSLLETSAAFGLNGLTLKTSRFAGLVMLSCDD